MKLPLLLGVLCLFYSYANSQDNPSVLIGTGGGTTGMTSAYRITDAGEVFRGQGISEIKYTECGKIKRSKAKEIISKVTDAVTSANFHHPGNIYHFLSLKEDDGEKKITWGDVDHKVPDNIKELFDEIQKAIADLKYRPIPETK